MLRGVVAAGSNEIAVSGLKVAQWRLNVPNEIRPLIGDY